MHLSVYEFFIENSAIKEFSGKRVLEVGSRNGSVRTFIECFLNPKEYTGVDIEHGKYVDLIVPAESVVKHFGPEYFEVVITTELLEHVINWRSVVNNLKTFLRKGGYIYITTRSLGYPYHGCFYDLWRYEVEDLAKIFSDFQIIILKKDKAAPGLFLKARKPLDYIPNSLSGIAIHSIVLGKRTLEIPSPTDMPPHRRLRYLFVSKLLSFLMYRLRKSALLR